MSKLKSLPKLLHNLCALRENATTESSQISFINLIDAKGKRKSCVKEVV